MTFTSFDLICRVPTLSGKNEQMNFGNQGKVLIIVDISGNFSQNTGNTANLGQFLD